MANEADTNCACVSENPEGTRRRNITEKVMEVLRAEKVTRKEAFFVMDSVMRAVDKEATLGYAPVSEV